MIAAALAAATMAGAPSGTAVGIGLTEWEVFAYRRSVPVGKVRFNITNLGEDGHDFGVRRNGRLLKKIDELPAGARTTMRFTFRRTGRYGLVCVLEGHDDLGMKTSIKVVPKKRR